MAKSGIKAKFTLKTSLLRSADENKTTLHKTAMVVPAANVDETNSEYILTVASPGFKREDFKILVENNILTIAAAKELSPECFVHDRYEYDYNHWKRIFSLPQDADAMMTRARYRDGELIIRIPKGKTDNSPCLTTIYVY